MTTLVKSSYVNLQMLNLLIYIYRFLNWGKAFGPDGLNAEHLRFAHPAITVYICALFRSIILHGYVPSDFCALFRSIILLGYVPNDFGCGIVTTLNKDATVDGNNVNNYRNVM